ncbi:MAG: imidazole glycerol phosphate synthase subunit HisH [Myxococcales bacterium]|nr:imidazole glycerol phosphate synthase subunit HisH [Myxococcales bacterium]
MSVVVLDYGAGNLASLAGALRREGLTHVVAEDATAARSARGPVVLPGVGHFRAAKEALVARGLWAFLEDTLRAGRPLVGICLGLQLLAEGSEEAPGEAGLGALAGVAARLPASVKVPHMGWSEVTRANAPTYVPAAPRYLYFVHSYALPRGPETALVSTHGGDFAAAAARGNVFGVQAHPERSGRAGQRFLGDLLRNLGSMT